MQLVPGPPGLEASTMSLGYRGGGITMVWYARQLCSAPFSVYSNVLGSTLLITRKAVTCMITSLNVYTLIVCQESKYKYNPINYTYPSIGLNWTCALNYSCK